MKFALASIALLSTSIAHAATPISGWYTGLFGGYAYLPNNVHKTYGNLTRSNASYWPGFDAGGSIGYKSTPMRYEGEVTYLNANLKQFTLNRTQSTGVGGYSNAILAMANVYYDFPNRYNCLQPFLGGGIGYAWVHATLNSTGPLVATQFSASNTRFAIATLPQPMRITLESYSKRN